MMIQIKLTLKLKRNPAYATRADTREGTIRLMIGRWTRTAQLEDRLRAIERYIIQARRLDLTGEHAGMPEAIDHGLRNWQMTHDQIVLDPLDRGTRWGEDDS